MAEEFFPLWWIFPSAVIFSTVAVSSGVSGALFFSPFFMLVVGLTPVQAVGAGLLTEVFGMGNGLRSYVQSKLVDYATARWLLLGSVPTVVVAGSTGPTNTCSRTGECGLRCSSSDIHDERGPPCSPAGHVHTEPLPLIGTHRWCSRPGSLLYTNRSSHCG